MHGFGPVKPEPESEEPVFHAEWEKRVFGMTLAAGFLGKWTLDMSRYARERQRPIDYLRHSYYETWLKGLETLLVEKGLVTAEEMAASKATGPLNEEIKKRLLTADSVEKVLARGGPVDMKIDAAPRFKPGDKVRSLNRHPTGHTRQPRYLRGRFGVIHEHYGAYVFPDRSAEGKREGRHLYSVRFEASELWGETAASRSAVFADLWEDYLEAA
jgi:nitrile hydratase